ncbi:MAG: cbb3-type cytochrome c oxidase subunit 3 [Limisphaera sp.]|jgi:cytochrome c oxidase cbb3-type subunit 3
MIKDVIEHVGGIGLYGIVSLLLFFAVFVGVLVWAFRLDRARLDSAARLPLETDSVNSRKEDPHE